jgi:hypothetical protein
MSISLTTRKRLWQRCGNRCAKCRCELHEDAAGYDAPSILGEECHILGDKPNSARYNDPLPHEERDLYQNLIILCSKCHKIIDDQENTYSVEDLRKLKADHEQWVRDTLGSGDPAKERDEIIYTTFIDEWSRQADLDHWEVWGSYMLSDGQPKMNREHYEQLRRLDTWLFSRTWPERYPQLRASFENFHMVLRDFLNAFAKHAEPTGRDRDLLETVKFYKRGEIVDGQYVLARVFDHHVELVEDLFLELTRAANYVCDRVRETISSTFRLKEGVVIITYGILTITHERPEYRGSERIERPYPGVNEFYSVREFRDSHFGKGTPPRG